MKKIERYTPEYPISNQAIFIFVKIDQLDRLESTIDKLVGMLIEELKKDEFLLKHWSNLISKEGTNRKTKYLETLTGKTWEEMKGERG